MPILGDQRNPNVELPPNQVIFQFRAEHGIICPHSKLTEVEFTHLFLFFLNEDSFEVQVRAALDRNIWADFPMAKNMEYSFAAWV